MTYFEGSHVTVDTSWTTVYDSESRGLVLPDEFLLTFELDNDPAGAAAISDFRVQIKVHEDAEEWGTWLEAADFTSNYVENMLWCSDEALPTCASGDSHSAQIRLRRAYAFRMQAKTAAGEATVLIRGSY